MIESPMPCGPHSVDLDASSPVVVAAAMSVPSTR